jgi:iron complex outermembrane receptor protein
LCVVATHNERDGLSRNLAKGGIYTDPQDVSGATVKFLWKPDNDLTAYIAGDYTKNRAFCCVSTWRKVAPGYRRMTAILVARQSTRRDGARIAE